MLAPVQVNLVLITLCAVITNFLQMGCIELLNNSNFNNLPLTSNLNLDAVFEQVGPETRSQLRTLLTHTRQSLNNSPSVQAVEMQFQLDPASVPDVACAWVDDQPVVARDDFREVSQTAKCASALVRSSGCLTCQLGAFRTGGEHVLPAATGWGANDEQGN